MNNVEIPAYFPCHFTSFEPRNKFMEWMIRAPPGKRTRNKTSLTALSLWNKLLKQSKRFMKRGASFTLGVTEAPNTVV